LAVAVAVVSAGLVVLLRAEAELPGQAPRRQEPELPVLSLSPRARARVLLPASRPAVVGPARRRVQADRVAEAPVPPDLLSRRSFSVAMARSSP